MIETPPTPAVSEQIASPGRLSILARGTTAAADRRFFADQVAEHLRRSHLSSILANSALAIAVVYVFCELQPTKDALVWLGFVLAFNFARLFATRYAAGRVTGTQLAYIYCLGAFLAGSCWGVGSILLFPSGSVTHQVFLAFVVGGLTAGAGSAYAPFPPAFFAFAAPALGPLSISFLSTGDELSGVMGTMLLLFGGFIAIVSQSFTRTIRHAIELQIDRHRLMDEQRVSEEFLQKAFHASPVIFGVTDANSGIILDVNETFTKLSGYSRDELVGRTSDELKLWVDDESRRKDLHDLTEKNSLRGREVQMRAKDGNIRDLISSGDLIDTAEGPRLLFIGQDVTHIKEATRVKSEFVSTVSHELRTPLTSIYGSLKLFTALMPQGIPSSAREILDIALRNTTRLTELVNDILDFEKLQSGKMQFEFKAVDLCIVAKESLSLVSPFTDQYGARVRLDFPDEPVVVRGDVQRLSQVIVNILSNAAKFSPIGSEIAISVFHRDGIGRVEIADRGSGIPEDFRERLFERFSQADSSTTRKSGGTGLGLNICKSIIDAYGGRIDYTSSVGVGTTFFFEIPLDTVRP